jgi:rhodanese-related sulfurtransferase
MLLGMRTTIDDLLARARRRLDRVTVADVMDAIRDGALIVDIRSEVQRARGGLIPGAIFHPRNVLEWRCDPSSGHDDPRLSGDLNRRIILVCQDGYQSSLAAATLQDLGFARATDLVDGFAAWAAAGLPVRPSPAPAGAASGRGAAGSPASARARADAEPDGNAGTAR